MATKRGTIATIAAGAAVAGSVTMAALQKTRRLQDEARAKGAHVPKGPYEAVVKRPLDALLAAMGLVALSPLMIVTGIKVREQLGSPVVFRQIRPGLVNPNTDEESFFEILKFRTMTDEKDLKTGELLPDEDRLTDFGRRLRGSSCDELPELINILKGEMAVVGPRPQLVRDMVFMAPEQRRRHQVRPGLTGLAQVSGRNALGWDSKLELDTEYVDNITFLGDARIVIDTAKKVVFHYGAEDGEAELASDFGDFLLGHARVDEAVYKQKMEHARKMLETKGRQHG